MLWIKLLLPLVTLLILGIIVHRIFRREHQQDIADFRASMYPYFRLGQTETIKRFDQADLNPNLVDPRQLIDEEEFVNILVAQHFGQKDVEPARDWSILGGPRQKFESRPVAIVTPIVATPVVNPGTSERKVSCQS